MGPKKKRKSKKQLKEEEMMAERLKREEAEQKAREEEARLREIERLRLEAKLKAKIEAIEQKVRDDILTEICQLFELVRQHDFSTKINQRREEQWERFLLCNRLPYPESAPVMHTHLYLWRQDIEETKSMTRTMEKSEIILNILNTLDSYIEYPLEANESSVNNWKDIREEYRFELRNKLNLSTFHLLRKIEERCNRIDFSTVDFKRDSENIVFGLWGWLLEPVSELDKRGAPDVTFPESGVHAKLPDHFAKHFVIVRAIRTIYDHHSDTCRTWSPPEQHVDRNLAQTVQEWYLDREDLRKEQERIEMENQRRMEELQKLEAESNLNTETADSFTTCSDDGEVKAEVDAASVVQDIKSPSPEPLNEIVLPYRSFMKHLSSDGSGLPTTRVKSLREIKVEAEVEEDDNIGILFSESDEASPKIRSIYQLVKNFDKVAVEEEKKQEETESIKKCLDKLFDVTIPDEIPSVALKPQLTDPSQILAERQRLRWEEYSRSMEVTVSEHELNLRNHCILGGIFYVDLIKHVPQAVKLGDESVVQIQYGHFNIEKENFFFRYEPPKVTESTEEDEEKPPPDDNIDRLIILEINLPQHVLWFEAPTVVLWDSANKFWSNEHVYDIKFNEEKQMMTLKVGRLDPIGLAAVRYNNLPFQTWELHPDWNDKEAVILSITASTVILEFLIKGNKVALQCLQNATGAALEPILGQFFNPNELIQKMIRAGVDLFPCVDTFLYVEGNSIKLPVLEEHVCLAMAMFANVYHFTWSRWNLPSGREKIVFQMKEALSKQSSPNYLMVMSNLYRTAIVNCSEVSPAFTETTVPDFGFYPDLYSMLSNRTSEKAMEQLESMSIDLILAVYLMLLKTNILSYS